MDIIQGIMVTGVAIIAIAILSYSTGNVLISVPAFSSTSSAQSAAWFAVMNNVSANAISAFTLTSISPLVLGAALIISILLGVFVYTQTR
jgi:hypothetical protein